MSSRSVRWPNIGEVRPGPGTWRNYDLLRTDAADYSAQTDLDGRIVWISDDLSTLVGRSQDSISNRGIDELVRVEDSVRLDDSRDVVRDGAYFDETVTRVVTADGTELPVAMRTRPIHSDDGQLTGFLNTFIDAVEYSSTLRALVTLSRASAVLIRAKNEQALLDDLCVCIVESGSYTLAWYGQAVADKSVAPIARAGLQSAYVDDVTVRWDDSEYGQGPGGRAIRSRKTEVWNHLEAEPDYAPWHHAASRFELRASIVLPVVVDGVIDGALMVYANEVGAFDALANGLFEDLAEDLGYMLGKLRG